MNHVTIGENRQPFPPEAIVNRVTQHHAAIYLLAGHRLVGHEGKCRNLHGHNYALEVYLTGEKQDEIGRILDFKLFKQRVNSWIDENWDHTFVLWEEDENGLAALRLSEPHRIYELDTNPTAENMAKHFLHKICPVILDGTGATAFKVRLWESEETCSEVSLDV